jgi:hypothetical protein
MPLISAGDPSWVSTSFSKISTSTALLPENWIADTWSRPQLFTGCERSE